MIGPPSSIKTTQKPEKDCSTLSNFDMEWIDGRSVNFSCIGISQTAKSYLEASNFCANLNSHLVEIFTESQQDFLRSKLRAQLFTSLMADLLQD